MKRRVWVAYDTDGLPIAVADGHSELAEICGVKPLAVKTLAYKVNKGDIKNGKYAFVEVEDDD